MLQATRYRPRHAGWRVDAPQPWRQPRIQPGDSRMPSGSQPMSKPAEYDGDARERPQERGAAARDEWRRSW